LISAKLDDDNVRLNFCYTKVLLHSIKDLYSWKHIRGKFGASYSR